MVLERGGLGLLKGEKIAHQVPNIQSIARGTQAGSAIVRLQCIVELRLILLLR